MKNDRGQNIAEYLLMVVAVCVVVIIFVGPTGFFRGSMHRSLNYVMVNSLERMASNVVLNTTIPY